MISNKLFETIPGYTTKKKPHYWRGQIDALLYELEDLKDVRIIEKGWYKGEGDSMETLMLNLEFTIHLDTGPVKRRVQFQIEPVLILRETYTKQRHRGEKIPEYKVSWKLMHDLLERKLAGARLGLVEIHTELMSYIVTQLPDGRQGTFGDFMNMVLEADRLNEVTQLEDKSRDDRETIEVDYKVREEPE